ncbi:hypothetical protein ES288_A02G173400v1, partial [Gossypium darwinii]
IPQRQQNFLQKWSVRAFLEVCALPPYFWVSSYMGSLSSTFPIENQNNLVTMRTLKNHLDRTKSLPFVKRITDFHLLLFLAMSHGLGSDVLALAACVSAETAVPEGYQLLIESMANTS